MVNAEKHKTITNIGGMLPTHDKEKMHELTGEMIIYVNMHSDTLMEYLKDFNMELNKYYDSLSGTSGGVLKIGTCKRILELYENVFFIKTTIEYNYHMLIIDGSVIKAILQECDNVLNCFKSIQERQNKNIDSKLYGGFYSVVSNENIDNDNDYPLENFENIVRLNTPISLSGADGMV